MDPRYQDPQVADLWSPRRQYELWLQIGREVVQAQAQAGVIPADAATDILTLGPTPSTIRPNDLGLIAEAERRTGHDVAAFLSWWEHAIPSDNGRYIHFGLTSSDLVDTALGLRFAQLEPFYITAATGLRGQIAAIIDQYGDTPVLGMTHGQPAEPTTLANRAEHWLGMAERASTNLWICWKAMRTAKLSGPVGNYAHNPPEVERQVAQALSLQPHGRGASQVVARDSLAVWATSAAQFVAACGKIATDFRLMAMRGEVREGRRPGKVGSSSMPHKDNPVTAEKICGMGRLAAGYAQALQPVDLWLERDISHSCVERVAVPDLLHVLLHTLRSTQTLLQLAEWDTARMADWLAGADRLPYTSWFALREVEKGASRWEAHENARRWAASHDLPNPPRPGQPLGHGPAPHTTDELAGGTGAEA